MTDLIKNTSFKQQLFGLVLLAVPAVIVGGVIWLLTHSLAMSLAVPTAVWTALGVARLQARSDSADHQ